MKITILIIATTLLFNYVSIGKSNKTFSKNEIVLIPKVQKMKLGESSFEFDKSTRFIVENTEQASIAGQLANLFEKSAGWKPEILIEGSKGSNQVYFKTDLTFGDEAYSLEVQKDRIEIKASKPAGFFYAMQTLRQLLPAEIESTKQEKVEWLVPVITITDSPAFKWRGYLLDVVRHFFPKQDVLKMIDNIALHKINTLHLHLVDDQGWRIEIKKYPRLTEVGA